MLNLSPSPAMRRPPTSTGGLANTPAANKSWGRMATPGSKTMSGQIGAQRPNPLSLNRPPIGNKPMAPQQGPGMMTPQFGPKPMGPGGPEMSAEMPSMGGGINTGPSNMAGGMGNAGPISGGGMQGIPGQQFNSNNFGFQGMAPMADLWANYNKMMGLGGNSTPTGNLFY